MVKRILIAPLLLALSGCYTTAEQYAHNEAMALCGRVPDAKPAWAYYQDCEAIYPDFIEMAECGKSARNKSCMTNNACSETGNRITAYADSLSSQIKSGALTQDQAQAQWHNYLDKNTLSNEAYAEKVAENHKATDQCYREAYLSLLNTETNRRSAADLQYTIQKLK